MPLIVPVERLAVLAWLTLDESLTKPTRDKSCCAEDESDSMAQSICPFTHWEGKGEKKSGKDEEDSKP